MRRRVYAYAMSGAGGRFVCFVARERCLSFASRGPSAYRSALMETVFAVPLFLSDGLSFIPVLCGYLPCS